MIGVDVWMPSAELESAREILAQVEAEAEATRDVNSARYVDRTSGPTDAHTEYERNSSPYPV